MTVEVYQYEPPPAVVFVLAWLAPLGACGEKRWAAGDPLPYRMVERIGGADCVDMFSDDALVRVHTFGANVTDAQQRERITHRRMQLLAFDPTNTVTMPDSSLANVQYLETANRRGRQDYGTALIIRHITDYRLGLQFVAAPAAITP